MEQHPVPQNVTTFQFRLIGDMTIKQFGYLAGGAIVAYICYKLPLPFFFTWPLTIASALLGFGLAFVPVEERPMDVWVLSFFKSIYSPTEYLWQKSKPEPEPTMRTTQATLPKPPAVTATPQPTPTPQIVMPTPAMPAAFKPAKPSIRAIIGQLFSHKSTVQAPAPLSTARVPQPAKFTNAAASPWHGSTILSWHIADPFGWIRALLRTNPKSAPPSTELPDIFRNAPTTSITGKRMDLSTPPVVTPAQTPSTARAIDEAQKKNEALTEKLGNLEKELGNKTMSDARILELQKQLTEALQQRTEMEKEIAALRQQAAAPQFPSAPLQQAASAPPAVTAQPSVRIISPEDAVQAGLPRLTTFPNVVAGIIKNHENELLAGVLVTVRDAEGIPLRALKTNKLGQFAASTPLPNGTYLVEVEDPRTRYTFDRAQIALNGTLVPTIEITAKSPKALSREKLAKEIFGNQNPN